MTRHLQAEDTPEGVLLAATAHEGRTYWSYLSGADPDAVSARFGDALDWHRQVGKGVFAATKVLETAPLAELEHFRDRRVVFAIRNGESAAATRDWISYYLGLGVTGFLIFDRSTPDEALVFKAEFEEAVDLEADDAPRVMIVTASHPMGRLAGKDAREAATAPGAPAHIRDAHVPQDQWHSEFGETVLLETLRRRYLQAAASVAFLDISDLLITTGAKETPFDKAEALRGRCYLLEGQEYYPWRQRKGRSEHVDHIYVRQNEGRTVTRWCVAPAGLEDPTIWRNVRIGGARGVVEGARFLRAMGVRYPDASISQVVHKASLIEDFGVRATLEEAFETEPLSAPKVAVTTDAGDGVTVVTAMKNEGPFILDWVAHHRVVGVDRFIVYTNDCADGTDEVLDALAAQGILVRRDNPYRETGKVPQYAAFHAAQDEPVVQDAAWCVTMDVDEYINIHVGDGTLADLFAATRDANVISMPWRLFGNGDKEAFEDAPVTRQFHSCAPEFCSRPHQAWGFKTIYRNTGMFRRLGVHRPKGITDQSQLRWVGGDGRPIPPKMWKAGWRMTSGTYGYDLVTLNHYAVRSAESYLVKRDRGRVNHVSRGQGVAYWFRMNHNGDEDRWIRKYDARVAEERARLTALPGVQSAHDASVVWHQRRIGELMQVSDFKELYDEITGERLRRLSRMLKHFGANVFLSGPDVIPDDLTDRPNEEDWQFTVPKPERAD